MYLSSLRFARRVASAKVVAHGAALFLAFCVLGGPFSGAAAQTISQPNGDTSVADPALGESFTATVTGTVTKIDYRGRQAVSTTLYLYNGANGSGTSGSVGTPAYQQAVNVADSGSNTSGFTTITLTTPFPVTAGQQYSFILATGKGVITFANSYAGGTALSNYVNGPSYPNNDVAFQVYEVATPVVTVPTLSEWALIAMAGLFGASGLWWMRRRPSFSKIA